MPHLTLSIPRKLYERMKEHAEIKWSEVARRAISVYLAKLGATSTSTEIWEMLSPETKARLSSVSERDAKKFFLEVSKREWKRTKSLIRAS